MYLRVKGDSFNYQLNFNYPLNVVLGNSSTGKTELYNQLVKQECTVDSDATYIELNASKYSLPNLPPNSLVISDLDSIKSIALIDAIATCSRNDIFFVLLGRNNIRRLPLAVMNTFKFITVKGITKNVPFVEHSLERYTNFNNVVVEDSESGFKFFSNVFKNVKSAEGAAKVKDYIRANTLLVFDTLGFGSYIEEFLDVAKFLDVAYLGYESYEWFILNTIFNYHELPKAINMEKAVTKKLNELKFGYSKSIGCTGKACNSCSCSCSQTSLQVFEKSKYSKFLDYEVTEEKDTIEEILDNLNFKGDREKIRKCLPIVDLSYEELVQVIETAISIF